MSVKWGNYSVQWQSPHRQGVNEGKQRVNLDRDRKWMEGWWSEDSWVDSRRQPRREESVLKEWRGDEARKVSVVETSEMRVFPACLGWVREKRGGGKKAFLGRELNLTRLKDKNQYCSRHCIDHCRLIINDWWIFRLALDKERIYIAVSSVSS